jgi:hypothetical protein
LPQSRLLTPKSWNVFESGTPEVGVAIRRKVTRERDHSGLAEIHQTLLPIPIPGVG